MDSMKSTITAKVSISLPPEILEFVEQYQQTHQAASRSEVFVEALRLLRERELAEAYRSASQEWEASEDARLWESTVGDEL
jgi:Arc/MetJ-type ribon-helix-helix transcriptional regulator